MTTLINATTSTGLQVTPDNSGAIQIQTNNGTNALYIDTSQNVGIGTTSPTQRLHVKSNNGQILAEATGAGQNPSLKLTSSSNNRNWEVFSWGGVAGQFGVYDGVAGANRLIIDTSGNVGIGTDSPAVKLDVNGSIYGGKNGTSSGYASLEGTGNTTNSGYVGFFAANGTRQGYIGYATVAGNDVMNVWSENATNGLNFGTNSTQRMFITKNGQIQMPYQPAFIAGIAATTDVSIGSGSFVPFNTTALSSGACNIGSNFNTSTYKFTAPIAGTYFFTYTLYYTNSGSSTLNMQPCLNFNGGYAAFTSGDAYGLNTVTPNSAGGVIAFSWSGLLKLAANDVVGVSNRGGNILRIYQGHCSFSGYLIG